VRSQRYINRNGKQLAHPDDELIDADRQEARTDYFYRLAFHGGTVFVRDLADHAPINYVSGVMSLRD